MKEKILNVNFSKTPIIKMRTINEFDSKALIKNKKQYPFELVKNTTVRIETDRRKFAFTIPRSYCWNGADIPRTLFIVGQSKENHYMIASMVHDYMLEYKGVIYNTALKRSIVMEEYRRLTSLIFREILKKHGTNVVKANIMSGAVDWFQKWFNRGQWKGLETKQN